MEALTAIGTPPLIDLDPRTRTTRALVIQEINPGIALLGPKPKNLLRKT
jgi:hypothetical protein